MVRPVKPAVERKQNVLRIRLTEDERVVLERAASGKVSTWARRILLKMAQSNQDSEQGTDTTNVE
jgi:hypothetical protein